MIENRLCCLEIIQHGLWVLPFICNWQIVFNIIKSYLKKKQSLISLQFIIDSKKSSDQILMSTYIIWCWLQLKGVNSYNIFFSCQFSSLTGMLHISGLVLSGL